MTSGAAAVDSSRLLIATCVEDRRLSGYLPLSSFGSAWGLIAYKGDQFIS